MRLISEKEARKLADEFTDFLYPKRKAEDDEDAGTTSLTIDLFISWLYKRKKYEIANRPGHVDVEKYYKK